VRTPDGGDRAAELPPAAKMPEAGLDDLEQFGVPIAEVGGSSAGHFSSRVAGAR
jgi:hypothetical protein